MVQSPKESLQLTDMKLTHEQAGSGLRMYCSDTDEVIFDSSLEFVNSDAKAFAAIWWAETMDEPDIKDDQLAEAWKQRCSKGGDDFPDDWDDVLNFLEARDSPEWEAIECMFEGMACGPVSYSAVFVVKVGTVVEEDPEVEEED